MEEKKNNSTIIFIIIIILLLIGMGVLGYLFWNANNKVNQLTSKTQDLSQTPKEKTEDELFADYIKNYVAKFENRINFDNNAQESLPSNSTRVDLDIKSINGDTKTSGIPQVTSAYIDKDFNVYVTFEKDSELYNKYGSSLKINNNCFNIYFEYYGNGGFAELLMLKKDGTVDTLNGYEIYQNKDIKVTKKENAKNVIGIMEFAGFGGRSYEFVTISGK